MRSSGSLVNRQMSLFLTVLHLSVGRGFAGNTLLDSYNINLYNI